MPFCAAQSEPDVLNKNHFSRTCEPITTECRFRRRPDLGAQNHLNADFLYRCALFYKIS
jgi:hypothetical protein